MRTAAATTDLGLGRRIRSWMGQFWSAWRSADGGMMMCNGLRPPLQGARAALLRIVPGARSRHMPSPPRARGTRRSHGFPVKALRRIDPRRRRTGWDGQSSVRGGEEGGEGGRAIRQRRKSIVGMVVVGWVIKVDQVGHVKDPCPPGQRGRAEWGLWRRHERAKVLVPLVVGRPLPAIQRAATYTNDRSASGSRTENTSSRFTPYRVLRGGGGARLRSHSTAFHTTCVALGIPAGTTGGREGGRINGICRRGGTTVGRLLRGREPPPCLRALQQRTPAASARCRRRSK